MMTEIAITVHDDIIWLRVTHNPDELDKLVSDIRDIVSALQDKAHRQQSYQNRYRIADNEIVQGFNGDMLKIAIDIRGYDDEDVAEAIGIKEPDIDDMLNWLVKPSQVHHQKLSILLGFPETFFLCEDRIINDNRFMCTMPSWAG